jgi:outer membrane protein TolC
VTSSQFLAGFDAAWELDIFGGVRRSVEAADADLLATVEETRGIFVTLAAEVAVNTIDLRAFQQRTLIARQNLMAQRHNAELTRKRFIGGLDVANADAHAATTAAEIKALGGG